MVGRDLDLAAQGKHVGIEPRADENGGIDLALFRIGRRLVEDLVQRGERALKDRNGSFWKATLRSPLDLACTGWRPARDLGARRLARWRERASCRRNGGR